MVRQRLIGLNARSVRPEPDSMYRFFPFFVGFAGRFRSDSLSELTILRLGGSRSFEITSEAACKLASIIRVNLRVGDQPQQPGADRASWQLRAFLNM